MNKHTHKKKYSESQVEEMLQTALNYMFMMYQQQNNNLDHRKYLEENNLLKNKIKYLEEINTVSNSKTENLGTVKMDLNEFEDKCDNFFKKENYENNIKKEYDYNIVILSNAISNNTNNSNDPQYENRNHFLNLKKSMINYRYHILSILNKLNISFKCTSLKNMMITQYGGDHDDINDLYNHKISKYASKFSQSNDIKYIQKLNDYIQDGGGIIATQNSSRFLKNIVYNSYDIITNQQLFKDKENLNICTGIKDITDKLDFTDNDIRITACIKQSTVKEIEKFNIEKLLYEFKKKNRILSTDMGILTFKNLNNNLLNLSGKYILTLLLATISEFIYEYNLSRNNTTYSLSEDDITVLYKGGNTTRLHMVEFYNSIPDDKKKFFYKMKDIISKSSVGDFDFNISLYKEALFLDNKRNFNIDEVKKIEEYLRQVLSLCTYNIKIVLNNIMDTNFSHDYITTLASKLNNTESEDDIKKFISDYNNLISVYNAKIPSTELKLKLISEIKLKHIIVPNYIYENNLIKTHTDPLEKNNILFKKKISDGISHNIVDNVTNYFTTNNLLETLVPHSYINNIYSVYIQGLKLIKGKRISYFDLFRLKLNNKLIYDLKYSDNTPGELKIPFGIEFIDISLQTSSHTIDIFCDNKKKKQIINFEKEECKYIYIPSVYYMYYDIVTMLLIETYLIWEEPKYDKRIKRLLYLAFLCNIKDNVSMQTITDNYIKFKNLLTGIVTEINNDKTNFVATFYNNNIKNGNFNYKTIRNDPIDGIHTVNFTQIIFKTEQVDKYNDYLYVKIYEMILYLYYFNNKTNTYIIDEHKKYCEDNTQIYIDIDNTNYIPDVTYLPSNIDNLTKMSTEDYNQHLINLTDCLNTIIEKIDEIIELSKLCSAHGISTVNMTYDKIKDLY